MIKKLRYLFLIFLPIITLVVWNGNATSIEIKLPFLQAVVSLEIILISFYFFKKKEFNLFYDIATLLTLIFLLISFYSYFSTVRMSINYRSAMPQIYSIVTFFIVYILFKKEHLKRLLEIICYTSVVASIYGILQFSKLDPIDWIVVSERLRVISFFGHKNYFALYLLIVIPLNFYLSVVEENKIKDVLFKFATFLCLLALILSYSRGALFSFILFSSISYILYLNRKRVDQIKIKRYLYFIPLLILIILPFIIPIRIKEDIANLYKKRELNVRIGFWRGAMEVASRNPLTGVGPGNFRNEYPLNKEHKIHSFSPNNIVDHVHNDFLEIYTEYGIFILGIYIAIIISFLVRFWKGYHHKDRKRNDYLLLLAIFCSLNSFIAYSLVTVAARYVSSLLYFWIALAIGEIILEENSKKVSLKVNPSAVKVVMLLIIVLITLFSFYTGSKRYYSSCLVHKSQDHMKRKVGNASNAISILDKALKIDSKNIEALYAKGYASFMIGEIDSAEEYYLKIYQVYPGYVNIAFNLASCYYKNNNWTEALFYAKESFRQYPGYTPNGVMLGYCYYYLRDPKSALYYCRMILERDPGNQGALNLKQKLSAIEEGGLL